MGPVKRVVIHDKNPVLEPEVFTRPVNRVAVGLAACSALVQIWGLAQDILGYGHRNGWFDYASSAFVAFLWLGLGVLVFLQRGARYSGRLFLLSAATGSAFLSLTSVAQTSLADAVLYTVGLLLFPPFLFSFARAFDETRQWRNRELLLYLPPVVLVWWTAQGVRSSNHDLMWRVGVASVAVYLVAAILQTIHDLFSIRNPERAAQTRALLFGLVVGTVPGTLIFVAPYVLSGTANPTFNWLPLLVLVFLFAMSYAVLLFEFSEAELIVRRGVVYGVLTLVIVVAYAALGVLLTAGRASVTGPGGGVSFVAVTVLIGACFTPITRTARRLVDWLLYGRRVDRWQLLEDLTRRLATVMQPEELGDVLVRDITDALHLRGAFLLRREQGGNFVLRHQARSPDTPGRHDTPLPALALDCETIEAALGEPPAPLLLLHAKPLTADRRDTVNDRYRVLDDLRAVLSIPLVTRSGLEAVLCLHPKLAHDAFDADDLELLAPVVRQATAALDNALLFARLEEKVDELRQAYMRIAREQEAERGRLARELHDGTAQELAGLITLSTVVERQMEGRGPALTTLGKLRQQAEDAYQGVRRASHALRPPMLADFGLGPTLARYLDQFQDATGIEVEYTGDEIGNLPDDVELALFRVAQECMENVRKHSGAHSASLRLERENGHVRLTVADAGRGMAPRGERGIGLAGMRERIEGVGGVIRVTSAPGEGVRVVATIPVGTES